jgi:hypothetical protein
MTTATRLTFSQFIDLLLARLYDAQRADPDGMVDLNELAADLRESVPDDWVVDAAKVMQAQGLADCMISYGACRARLTGMGMLFVEQDGGSGVIRQYHQGPAQFFQHVHVSGAGSHQVVVGNHQNNVTQTSTAQRERPQVFHLIDQIQERIANDSTLAPDEREEIGSDIESVRQQMKKRVPNLSAVAAILEPMGRIASVAGQVAMLIKNLYSNDVV